MTNKENYLLIFSTTINKYLGLGDKDSSHTKCVMLTYFCFLS